MTGLFCNEGYETADWLDRYATCRLRRIRSVLAPNGSSMSATEIIVVGSSTQPVRSGPKNP